MAFPAELDSRFLLARLYGDDSINGRQVPRPQPGDARRGPKQRHPGRRHHRRHHQPRPGPGATLPSFPPRPPLYDSVWGLIPDFLRAKIARWAADDKQGDIAEAITEFVKTALGLLPIPVPSFFLNGRRQPGGAAVVPQGRCSGNHSRQVPSLEAHHALADAWHRLRLDRPNTHYVMRDLDRKILLSAGLPAQASARPSQARSASRAGLRVSSRAAPARVPGPSCVRASPSPAAAAADDAASSTTDDDPLTASALASGGQPDNNEGGPGPQALLHRRRPPTAASRCTWPRSWPPRAGPTPLATGTPTSSAWPCWRRSKGRQGQFHHQRHHHHHHGPRTTRPDKAGIADLIYPTVHDPPQAVALLCAPIPFWIPLPP
ncbi:hypothetical protein G6O67_000953 [Ophiocordyceps sinensis]|uniref:Uncharacterized protein n=1 Tax=Ophiocordyceps sinensis TaxID=72228 RepID=A0A8H4Q0B5_9HYPO|nr:hypothetical protein G6O67_000953 [Ophiocordyceps sinensis]